MVPSCTTLEGIGKVRMALDGVCFVPSPTLLSPVILHERSFRLWDYVGYEEEVPDLN